MNVLILVASCLKPPYDELWAAQERTWDSIKVDGVETFYYACTELDTMHVKLAAALSDALTLLQWDFVFRTNSSSYVDKARMLAMAETLPREKCYCGIDGDGFASGSGFFLSRDAAEILARDLPTGPQENTQRRVGDAQWLADDVLCGRALAAHGIGVTPGARRYDYWTQKFVAKHYGFEPGRFEAELRDAYHVRCKFGGADRRKDVEAMEAVHKIKTQGRGTDL